MPEPLPADGAKLTVFGALGAAAASGAFTVAQTWRYAPGWLVRVIAANLVMALTPSAQVLSVAWLVRASGGSAHRSAKLDCSACSQPVR